MATRLVLISFIVNAQRQLAIEPDHVVRDRLIVDRVGAGGDRVLDRADAFRVDGRRAVHDLLELAEQQRRARDVDRVSPACGALGSAVAAPCPAPAFAPSVRRAPEVSKGLKPWPLIRSVMAVTPAPWRLNVLIGGSGAEL